MRKQIKKLGQTPVITFTKEDMRLNGWQMGDVLECKLIKIQGEPTPAQAGAASQSQDEVGA